MRYSAKASNAPKNKHANHHTLIGTSLIKLKNIWIRQFQI